MINGVYFLNGESNASSVAAREGLGKGEQAGTVVMEWLNIGGKERD